MTNKYRVLYSPAALDDLVAIYRYIAVDLLEPTVAEKQVNRIREFIKKLNTLPSRHQIVEWQPWSSMGMRYAPVDNYVVYYLVDDTNHIVTINRIFYGGQDVKNIINNNE